MKKARKSPLFLGLLDGRRDNGPVAQSDHVLNDAVRDLVGIPLALFLWLYHAESLPRREGLAETKLKVAHYRTSTCLGI